MEMMVIIYAITCAISTGLVIWGQIHQVWQTLG